MTPGSPPPEPSPTGPAPCVPRLPPGLTPEEVTAAGKTAIEGARERLIEENLKGSGAAASARYAAFHDRLIAALFDRAALRAGTPAAGGGVCLAAIGGYGYGELALRSDIDLLILIERRDPRTEAFVRDLCLPLYDWGLDVGAAVRTVEDALEVIGRDLESATAMMEARRLAGDAPLFERFTAAFGAALRGPGRGWYLRERLGSWCRRRERYDDSVYLLEPNLKEGTGGMRDADCVRWLLLLLHGTTDFAELTRLGICAAGEAPALTECLDFVRRLRNELHGASARKTDLLNDEAQLRIAPRLGFTAEVNLSPEEVMMRAYYRRARRLHKGCSRAFHSLLKDQSDARGPILTPLARRRIDEDSFERDGRLEAAPACAASFESDPAQMMAFFARAAARGMRVGDETRQSIEKIAPTAGEALRLDPAAREAFLAILAGPPGVGKVFADMHDCGLLGAWIPEFDRVHCMVRIDHYHRYTVDDHLIHAVRALDTLLVSPPEGCRHAAEVARGLPRLDLMRLSLLLHDVGKGFGRGHALRGGQIIQGIGHRLELPAADIDTLRFLVISHLKLSHAAQRRDLEDPGVARGLAAEVRSAGRLDMLYVHTVCDQMAVSPGALTDWRVRLFATCYDVTRRALDGAGPPPEPDGADVSALAASLAALLDERADTPAGTGGEQDIRLFLEDAPTRYRTSTPQAIMAEHYLLRRRLSETERVLWTMRPGAGATELIVCSSDVPGAFARTCGAIAARGLNVCSAQIFSTLDGVAINRFQVTGPGHQPLPGGIRLARLFGDLNKVFLGEKTMEDLLARHSARHGAPPPPRADRPTEVRIRNDASADFTLLEVITADRPGLLYRITSILDRHALNVHLALVNTDAYRVVDVFYVTDLEYNKIHDPKRVQRLETELMNALQQDGGAAAAAPGPPDPPAPRSPLTSNPPSRDIEGVS